MMFIHHYGMQQTERSGGLVLGFGADRSAGGAGRGGQARCEAQEARRSGLGATELQLWVSGTDSAAALQGRQSQVVQSNSLQIASGQRCWVQDQFVQA
jgi:hypothetical protein